MTSRLRRVDDGAARHDRWLVEPRQRQRHLVLSPWSRASGKVILSLGPEC